MDTREKGLLRTDMAENDLAGLASIWSGGGVGVIELLTRWCTC